jgi:hypothetical protein
VGAVAPVDVGHGGFERVAHPVGVVDGVVQHLAEPVELGAAAGVEDDRRVGGVGEVEHVGLGVEVAARERGGGHGGSCRVWFSGACNQVVASC